MTSEREPTRKKVSELEAGDVALHFQLLAPTSKKLPYYEPCTVVKVTEKFVCIFNGKEFYRDTGLPRYKSVRGQLVDATDEHVAAWKAHKEKMDKRRQEREEERQKRDSLHRRQALAAAGWLASSNAETIYQKIQLYELVELYDRLKNEGLICDLQPEDRTA